MKTTHINLFAGPGVGKSTLAAELYVELKKNGIVTELSHEYAKELVYDKNLDGLKHQDAIFEEQSKRIIRLDGQVQVAIHDSPILLSSVYCSSDKQLGRINSAISLCKEHKEINIFLERDEDLYYEVHGRMQNLEEAKELDVKIKELLSEVISHYSILIKGAKDSIIELLLH